MELTIPAITIRIPTLSGALKLGALTAATLALALCAARDGVQSAATNSITSPETGGNVGRFTSLALNGSGNPVLSYTNVDSGLVATRRCGDANCAAGNVLLKFSSGIGPSLEIDAQDRPTVSYRDDTDDDLMLTSCSNLDCTVQLDVALDSAGQVGSDSSLTLDAEDRPVVSYFDFTNGDLKVARCNDADCLGFNESITSPDTAGFVGSFTSIELDSSGFPVVSYFDGSNSTLKVMHCNDANCAGGDESLTSPDPAVFVGSFTSLELDAQGRPVVSYLDSGNQDLKLMHCNDADCAGGGESITSPDTAGSVGANSSLALDAVGQPVVSYYDSTNGDLKVMRCNDVNCAGGGESIVSPDTGGSVGQYTSLALDASGFPVVSYYDITNGDLKVLHCGTPTCNNNPAEQEIRATSLTTGWPGPMGGVCYNVDPTDTADATFVVCDNETGGGVDTSPRCTKDVSAACTDDDPVLGSIAVAVLAGTYDLTINSAPGHLPDTHVKSCNVSAGVDAKCAFSHTPITRPWFPWDLNGDGAVAGTDIFLEIGHFNQTK